MFRTSSRELLLLTTIIGVCAGWFLDHRALANAKNSVTAARDELARDIAILATYSSNPEWLSRDGMWNVHRELKRKYKTVILEKGCD